VEKRDTESNKERDAKKRKHIPRNTQRIHMLRSITQEPVQLDVARATVADVRGIRSSHFRKIQREETCSHVKEQAGKISSQKTAPVREDLAQVEEISRIFLRSTLQWK
jgi:hypothetical protein